MRVIWKFNLEARDRQTIEMPRASKILSVGAQDLTGATVQLWAEVNPDNASESRTFLIAGTGHQPPLASTATFLGTVITAGGALVWHVYEEKKR